MLYKSITLLEAFTMFVSGWLHIKLCIKFYWTGPDVILYVLLDLVNKFSVSNPNTHQDKTQQQGKSFVWPVTVGIYLWTILPGRVNKTLTLIFSKSQKSSDLDKFPLAVSPHNI